MKYAIIVLTILLVIFVPQKKEVVEIVEAKVVGEEVKNTNAIAVILPSLTPTPTKSIYPPASEIEALICQYFGDDCRVAVAIAKAESGLRCDAHGDRSLTPSSYGLFQIRAFHNRPGVEELTDCEQNIKYAKFMFDRQHWSPWSAYNNGSYLSHL